MIPHISITRLVANLRIRTEALDGSIPTLGRTSLQSRAPAFSSSRVSLQLGIMNMRFLGTFGRTGISNLRPEQPEFLLQVSSTKERQATGAMLFLQASWQLTTSTFSASASIL